MLAVSSVEGFIFIRGLDKTDTVRQFRLHQAWVPARLDSSASKMRVRED